jgi:hypothetical protein
MANCHSAKENHHRRVGHNKYAGTTDRVETLHRGLEKLATLWRL